MVLGFAASLISRAVGKDWGQEQTSQTPKDVQSVKSSLESTSWRLQMMLNPPD